MDDLGGYTFLGFAQLPGSVYDPAGPSYQLKGTFTVNPGTNLITTSGGHGQAVHASVLFSSSDTLPNPLIEIGGPDPLGHYLVLSDGLTANTFKVAGVYWQFPNPEPAPIDITDIGVGTHYLWVHPFDPWRNFTSAGVNVATDTIDVGSPHLLIATPTFGDRIRFSSTGTLPAPLTANTDYYGSITGMTETAFKVAIGGSGGAIVNLTSGGSGTHTLLVIRAGNQLSEGVLEPTSTLGWLNEDAFYFVCGDHVNIIGGGGGGGGGPGEGGGEPLEILLPRPTIKTRDPELASILRRARKAVSTIEDLTIVGAAGTSEDGFSL
jgi:hypothetical protein